ncbi:VCBS repeat-containing protein [Luteolibacter yonseiensis]|uniref:VCBS repeat-containing protein n=1 Tax=Luteolibacter yonseiensis TaxID=1144680 RepID=A0A934V8Y3_9BACT|nr:RHS repeat-associated core domain-containing protein [Luteolibacter yonseiensis]MBK1814598.1 VCBS repeat-containing protein [Luteolibacter yonseiensis]
MSDHVSLPKKALAVFLNFAFLLNQVYAAVPSQWRVVQPDWWSDSDTLVVDPGMGAPVNYGLANIGQAKWMVSQALKALEATAPGTATAIRADLSGIVDLAVPSPITQEWRDKQNSVLLVGQLKALATPFYTRLNQVAPAWLDKESASPSELGQLQLNGTKDTAAGAENHYLPWSLASGDDKNKAIATIGQLKAVFSLRFEHLLNIDSDGDGMTDLWEVGNGSNPNLYDRNSIKPGTSDSFYNLYLRSLGVGSEGYASAPPPGLGTIPGLTLEEEAPHRPVTALKGSLSVGADGSANYSIPIDIPKGTAGMEPKLSLSYSSGAGNGVMGVGWSLGGLQRITRGPSSVAKDGFYDPMNFDVQGDGGTKDRFFLDGERLICVEGVYGAAGSVYRTEIDSFARITAVGAGPSSWKMETKAGLIVTLGATTNSKLSLGSGPVAWCVDKVSDTLGNYYTVDYLRDDPLSANFDFTDHRVSTIKYTGNANGLAPYCSIDFTYEDRPDISRSFSAYSGSRMTLRLAKIRVKTGGYVNHDYVLEYEVSDQSRRSMLTNVMKFMNGGRWVEPTRFVYDGLQDSDPLWKNPGATSVPTYSDGLDASDEVNSMVSTYDGNTSIRLAGDAARAYKIPDTTIYPDTRITFEVSSGGLDTGAFIGLDGDATYQSSDAAAFCRIGGDGSTVKMADGVNFPGNGQSRTYNSSENWKTITLTPGADGVTGVKKYLVLMCVDNDVDNGVDSVAFRNVKIYRSGSQTPANVAAVAFETDTQLPRFTNEDGEDLGVTSLDLDSDGLPDLADWRVVDYLRNPDDSLTAKTYGRVYRNTGDGFVVGEGNRPPGYLPLGTRHDDGDGYDYNEKHHLLAQPTDIDGDGDLDLMGSVNLKTSSDESYLKNEYTFYSFDGTAWIEKTGWKLPFYMDNTSSSAPDGGSKRDEHFQWVDLNSDGYQDLVVHTTDRGRLYDLATGTQLLDPDSNDDLGESFAFINNGKAGPGWTRDNKRYLPVPLMEDGKDVGRRILDLDGDGIPEIAQSRYESGTLVRRNHFLMSSGSYFWTAATTSHLKDLPTGLVLSNDNPSDALLVDLNGDGLTDMLRSCENKDGFDARAWMNRGTRAWDSETDPGGDAYAQLSSYRFPYPLHFESDMDNSNWRIPHGFEMADLNGDGLVDVLYSDENNPETSGSDNLAFLNTGDGWKAKETWGVPSSVPRIYTSESERKDRKRHCRLQDVNGDGFPDLITGLLGGTPQVWYNNCRPEVLISVTDGLTSELKVDYKRLNDPTPIAGFDNHRVYEKGDSALPAGQSRVIDSRLVVSSYSEPDGRNGRRVRYQRYGDLRYDRYNESSLGFGWIEAKDGLNSQITRTETHRSFPFGGSPIWTQTWALVGAGDMAPTVPAIGTVPTGKRLLSEETAEYSQMPSSSGVGGTVRRPVQTKSVKTLYDLAGTKVSQTTTTQAVGDFDPYGFVNKSTVASLDGTQVVTQSAYDNLTTSGRWYLGRLRTTTVTKSGGGRPTLVKNSAFDYYETTHGLLKTETIEPGSPLASTKTYTYDTSGNITATSVTGSGITRTSTSEYDSRRRFVTSESNQLNHTVRYRYDQQSALLRSTTDINGLTTRFEYDLYGTRVLTRHPDGTKTGESTGYYNNDPEKDPTPLPSTVLSYLNAPGEINPVGIRYYRATQTSGSPVAIVYLDPYGREVATATTILRSFVGGLSSYSKIYTVTRYDSLGRKVYITEPFAAGEVPRFTAIRYDVVGRVLSTTHPDLTTDQVETFSTVADLVNPLSYSLSKTSDGRYLQRWEDQHGRMVQSCDASGLVTRFIHDQEGRVATVELGGTEVLRNQFDIFGNKYQVWETNSGTSSSAYNAFGEVTSSTNANGKVTNYFYDVLGRVERVQKPDGEGDYYTFYDQALGAGKGKPWKTTGPDHYQETVAYDSLGRPGVATKTQVAPGQTLPETSSTITYYDALGRVSSETDAGGLTIVHTYDSTWSFPTKLTIGPGMPGAGKDLWKAGEYDSRGRATSQFLAQDVATTSTYHPVKDQLATLTASRAGTNLQSKAYTWYDNKNLWTRTDVLKSLSETFEYDNLNRLTKTTSSGSGVPPVAIYGYAANGNLESRPGATLTYAGTRPHAVSSATIKGFTRNYVYDDAGYVKNDGRREYKWTSFGQLKELKYASAPALQDLNGVQIYAAGGQVESKFSFDAGGNRAGQLKERLAADDSRLLEETLYLGSYEREIHSSKASSGATPVITRTVHRHNIGGFAVYTRTVKPGIPVETKLTTILKDHLGSTDVLLTGTWNGTDFASQTIEEQSFDPWGERRAAGNLNNFRTSDSSAFRTSARDYDRGYTGHEQLDDSGLIHMNGRLYDPELGRMLSPDPYVQVPEYSQNFNRYSYVMNNPLNMTDPSGFSWLSKAFKSVGNWLKENWRTVVVIVVAAVLTIVSAGTLSGFGAALYASAAGVAATSTAATLAGYAFAGAAIGAVTGGLGAALAGGNLGDVLRGAMIGGISGALTGAMHMVGGTANLDALNIAGHGVIGGASNVAMGGKFEDGFLSAAASAATTVSGLTDPGSEVGANLKFTGRTAVASIAGGTASVLGGGKFANGATTGAMSHLLNAEAPRIGARLTYYVKERMLTFYNPENDDAAVFRMNSGAGDYRTGRLSTEEYPDMTNDPDYEGFRALGSTGPAGPLPRGEYRIGANDAKKAGYKTFALYPQDDTPSDLFIKVRNPRTGLMNSRSEFLIHLGTPGGIGCIVVPNPGGTGAPTFERFLNYMERVKPSGSTYGYVKVVGSMYD